MSPGIRLTAAASSFISPRRPAGHAGLRIAGLGKSQAPLLFAFETHRQLERGLSPSLRTGRDFPRLRFLQALRGTPSHRYLHYNQDISQVTHALFVLQTTPVSTHQQ